MLLVPKTSSHFKPSCWPTRKVGLLNQPTVVLVCRSLQPQYSNTWSLTERLFLDRQMTSQVLSPLQLHTAQNVRRSQVSGAQSCYFHTFSGSLDSVCPYSRVEFLSLHWPYPVHELRLCAKKLKINTGDLCFSIGAVTERLAADCQRKSLAL